MGNCKCYQAPVKGRDYIRMYICTDCVDNSTDEAMSAMFT